jgi:hypothetical protein
MDRPERVGLVFPRSGQQLYVHLPAQVAQTMQKYGQQDRTVVLEQSSRTLRYGNVDKDVRNQ